MKPKSTNYKSLVRFHVSAMVLMPLLLWRVVQCSLAVQYKHFGVICYCHLQARDS